MKTRSVKASASAPSRISGCVFIFAVAAFATCALEAGARADIGDRIVNPASAAPGELGIVPQSMPMSGLAIAGSASLQLGRREGGGGDPTRWTAGLVPILSIGLWGLAQADAALPLHTDVSEGSGSTFWRLGAGPARFALRVPVPVPGLGRPAGEPGLGIGLRLGAAIPLASDDAGRNEVFGGIAIDHQMRWWKLGLVVEAPVLLRSPGASQRIDLDLGLAGRISLCGDCDRTLLVGTRWRFPVSGPVPAAGDHQGQLFASLSVRVASGVEIEALAAARATGAMGAIDWNRIELSGLLLVRLWAGTRQQALTPASIHEEEAESRRASSRMDVPFAQSDAVTGPGGTRSPPNTGGSLLAQVPDGLPADGHPRLKIDVQEAARDALEAIALANRRYLEPALARRGWEALNDVLAGTAMGAVIGTAFLGTTLYAGASVEVTMVILRALGLTSLVVFGAERAQEIAGVFDRFLATAAYAHGEADRIDLAARQYAEAVAIITGAAAESLVYLVLANKAGEVMKGLEDSPFAKRLGMERIRAWLVERADRLRRGRTAGAPARAPAPAAPPASAPAPRGGAGTASPPSPETPALNEQNQARRYRDYVRRQVHKGKTPLGREAWEPRYGGRPHNPHGGRGTLKHQAAVSRLTELARQEYPDPGRYLVLREQSAWKFMDPTLRRAPDVTVYDIRQKRIIKVYEAGRTERSGRPALNERRKHADYAARGILYYFLAVEE